MHETHPHPTHFETGFGSFLSIILILEVSQFLQLSPIGINEQRKILSKRKLRNKNKSETLKSLNTLIVSGSERNKSKSRETRQKRIKQGISPKRS